MGFEVQDTGRGFDFAQPVSVVPDDPCQLRDAGGIGALRTAYQNFTRSSQYIAAFDMARRFDGFDDIPKRCGR